MKPFRIDVVVRLVSDDEDIKIVELSGSTKVNKTAISMGEQWWRTTPSLGVSVMASKLTSRAIVEAFGWEAL